MNSEKLTSPTKIKKIIGRLKPKPFPSSITPVGMAYFSLWLQLVRARAYESPALKVVEHALGKIDSDLISSFPPCRLSRARRRS